MTALARWMVASAALACAAVGADYEARVDIKNVSGEAKRDWRPSCASTPCSDGTCRPGP